MLRQKKNLTYILVLCMIISLFCGVNVSAQDVGAVEDFVERLYTIVLEREPSDAEVQNWANDLISGTYDGANAAFGFVFSDEFQNKNFDDAAYINVLYKALMGRDADEAGFSDWMTHMSNGVSRRGIFKAFVDSQEFANLCAAYGIEKGTIQIGENRDINFQITGYVTRCYNVILGRGADIDGLNDWTGRLLSGGAAGADIVAGFVQSDEFKAQNLDYDTQVERMYNAMLGRGSDPTGKANWLSMLNDGALIIDVVAGFAGSQEFANLCAKYQIAPGTVAGSGYIQVNDGIKAFVTRCYNVALGRNPDPEGFKNWTYKIAKQEITPEAAAYGFVFSSEVTSKNLSNDAYLNLLYQMCFGRDADAAGYADWISKLNSGASREGVFFSFTNSAEFITMVQSFGLTHTPGSVVLTESKKGIQGVDYMVCDPNPNELGIKHVLFNLDITKCINPSPDANSYPWPYKGENYYFNAYVNQQATMCHTLETQGIDVTMVLLMSYDSRLSYLTHTGCEGGKKTYYAWNLQNEQARKQLEATLAFLFSEGYPTVDNWIIGNEVNMPNHYNYTGTTDLNTNANLYADQMVFAYNVLKENGKNPNAKVYMSLDHSWGHNDEGRGIAGNQFLPAVVSAIEAKQAGVEWHVAYHAYAPLMQYANMWNSEYLNHSFDTPFICGSNLEVLTDFIKNNYGSNHRVILSEQGITSADGDTAQAAGLVYTYYAAQFNDMVDAVIFRSYMDDRNDGPFTFGLRPAYYQDILSGAVSLDSVGYRESYNVFKYMDTPQSLSYADKYLSVVGSESWSNIVPGFNADLFKYMY